MHLAKKYVLFSILTLLTLLLTMVAVSAAPQASKPRDTQALQGLSSAKAVFMLNVKDARRMAHVLSVIEKTDKGMRAQGVEPEIVVVFIGPSVAFLTRDRRGISYKDQRNVAAVQKGIRKLKALGIRSEVCGVALKGMDIVPADVIPEVQPVGNGFISAIGYQAQGYALVPVF
ncbi:MAG: hypothetical protein BMS9Abin25_0498 [Gammaproteobacteria bacterium]|nr:MAG: hypothetical protein BMS9Abin25_0498 [Gammaproteobacteria bacterium]